MSDRPVFLGPGMVVINGVRLPTGKIRRDLLGMLQGGRIKVMGDWFSYPAGVDFGTGIAVIALGKDSVYLRRSVAVSDMCIPVSVLMDKRPSTDLEIADILRGKTPIYSEDDLLLVTPDGCDFDGKELNLSWDDGTYRPLSECFIQV